MATPNDVRNAMERTEIRNRTAEQSYRIGRRLDALNVPTESRRAAVRAKGYRGPLTRAELAKRVSNAS